jgi:TP901 family phage tail tape measure protein
LIFITTHDHDMAKAGEASILAVADVSKFAAQLQKDLNSAIAGIKLNADNLGKQISQGVKMGVDQANIELRRLGDQSGQITNIITNNSNRAGQNMAAAFSQAGAQMSSVGEQMSMFVSLPLAAAGTITAKAAGNFEQMMNRVKAATEATGPVFEQLRQQAIDLGATTAFSATEAAGAMQILATAGFDTTQIMDAVPAVLNMAAAGAVDLATAAEIGSDILNGFGFQAKDLTQVNDVLARTFMATATSLVDLGNSFKYVGPIAKGAGLSFEETSAAIGLMGNAGIKGEMAGTALRGALSRLMSPTKDVTEVLSKLGISLSDSSGNMLPLVEIMKRLEDSGATTADMMKLFGQEAGSGMMAMLSQGSGALANLTSQLRSSGGTADKVAKTQMQGLNAKLDELSGAVETLMIAIGDAGLLGVLTRSAARTAELIASLSQASPVILNIVAVVGTVLAAAGPLLLVVGKMVEAIGFLIPWFKKLGTALKAFGTSAIAFFATPAGWVVLAIAAIVAAMVIAYKYSDKFRAFAQRAFEAVGNAGRWLWTSALQPAFASIVNGIQRLWKSAGQLWSVVGPVFARLGQVIRGAWVGSVWPMLQDWAAGFVVAGGKIRTFWTAYVAPAIGAIVGWFRKLSDAVRVWWTGNGDAVFSAARGVMGQVGSMISTIWSGVMAVFRAVGTVVGWVFTNVVIPVVKAVIAVIKLLVNVIIAMKPVWTVIGAIIVTAVGVIIAIVRVLWAAFVLAFNAIAAVVQWLWNSVVKPVFSFLGVVIQAAAAVISWLWSTVISPVVMFIANALGVLGSVLMWLWTSVVVPVWNAIGSVISFVWNSIIMPVFNALKIAVGAVVAVFQWLWSTFGPVIMAIGNLLWTVWSGIISIVFSLLKLAFYAVVGVVKIFWSVIQAVFTAVAGIFMAVWSGVIQPLLSMIGSLFTWLWGVIQPILAAVGSAFSSLWSSAISPLVTAIGSGLTWLWGQIVSIFNAVVGVIRSAIGQIVAAAGGVAAFVNSISAHFQSVVNAVRDKINAAIGFVRGLPGQITSAIGSLGSLLYNAGQNVINGLINGISSRIGDLRSKISDAAATIRNALPFSPAKEGPLSGRGDPTIAGGKIVSMVASGMLLNISELKTAAYDLAAASRFSLLPDNDMYVESIRQPMMQNQGATTMLAEKVGPRFEINVQALDSKTAATVVIDAIREYERRNGKGWRS